MKSKVLLGLMLITSNALLAEPHYSITALGTLGGDESSAMDINDNGQIVGTSKTSEGKKHAFISSIVDSSRVITDLGTLPESDGSTANAINNQGQVVGVSQFGLNYHAFIAEKSGDTWIMSDIHGASELPSSVSTDINNNAQIIGYYSSPVQNGLGHYHGVFIANKAEENWSTTVLSREADTPYTLKIARGVAITDHGQIALNYRSFPFNRSYTARRVGSNNRWQLEEINPLTGLSITVNGNNIYNQLVGYSFDENNIKHAIIASQIANEWITKDLGLLDGSPTSGEAINRNGTVVGSSSDKAFVYNDKQMYSLLDQVSIGQDGWTNLTKAMSINKSGQIVGEGIYNGKTTAFVASPISIANCEMGLDPQIIKRGEGTALWWWTENAQYASVDGEISSNVQIPSHYQWIYPSEGKTYTMSILGDDGITTHCEANIIVEGVAEVIHEAPVCEIGADPQTIRPGEGTALWWWTSGVISASINNDIGSVSIPSDYKWFYPNETSTYTIKVENTDGITASCETTIKVIPEQPIPVPTPRLRIK